MSTRIHFVMFVIYACMICNTSAIIQEIIGKYFENLKKNMDILNKEKGKTLDYEYVEDDYLYDESEVDYKPKPAVSSSSPKKGSGAPVEADNYSRGVSGGKGGDKKYSGSGRDDKEPVNPRPPAPSRPSNQQPVDKTIQQSIGTNVDKSGTLKVLTVKKFMFQAQPVTPVSRKNAEMTKLYYYL